MSLMRRGSPRGRRTGCGVVAVAVHRLWWRWPLQPGSVRVPASHERRQDAEARRDLLGRRLEQHRPVGGLQRVAVEDGRLEHPGTGLGVEPLERHAEGPELVQQGVEVRLVLALAQDGVAEHARRQRRQVAVVLLAQRGRRLEEVEPLELQRRPWPGSPRSAASSSTRRSSWRGHTASGSPLGSTNSPRKKRRSSSQGMRRMVDRSIRPGVRVAALPAGVGGVVVALVARVPAEHDVAEPERPCGPRPGTCPCPGTCPAGSRRCR